MIKQIQQGLLNLSFLALLLGIFSSQVANAQCPANTWTSRTSASDNNWPCVTYGNGLFVAVAANGTGNRVMTSPDGITWTTRTSAADNNWRAVTYGNGLFVAVAASGSGNRVMTSPDGITWTSRSSAADNDWYSVMYGNGLFVAVSQTGTNRIMTSPDGITWTSRTAAVDNFWVSVTYGNGLFVAVSLDGTNNRVMTSPDGITWTSRTSAANNNWLFVTYGNGLFVAVAATGTGNRVMTSPDGINWTSRTSATDNSWLSVTYANNLFVAVAETGTGNRVMTSPDGITWTSRTSAADNGWRSVTYGNGVFVAVSNTGTGNRVMTSTPPTQIIGAITGSTSLCSNATTTLSSPSMPTGGTITTSGEYRIHTFTSSGTFTVPTGFSANVEVLVVAGGGGGGNNGGGGGGAGGLISNSSYNITGNTTVTVGAGSGYQTNGGNSVFGTLTAIGGGYGATRGIGGAAQTGGSGGGGGGATAGAPSGATAGSGTASQGNAGGNGTAADQGCNSAGGGGGGAGSAGTAAASTIGGNGGSGLVSSITGTAVTYAAGGGGGRTCTDATLGIGGSSIGGNGGGNPTSATNGATNTGSGGGGGGGNGVVGTGGSGIVIVRYLDYSTSTWTSSNTDVATVNSSGVVTGVSAGSTVISKISSNCYNPSTLTVTITASVTPSVSISANTGNNITTGTSVTFTATPSNGGSTPAYQWKKNNTNVGSNSVTYTDAAMENGDIITCVLTSNDVCASPLTGTSGGIAMTVNPNTTWNGSTWSNGLPTSTSDAIIASNTAPSSFTCKDLTISSTFALTTTGITATVYGNIANNGNGLAGTGSVNLLANCIVSGNTLNFNGTLTLNGLTAQTFNANAATVQNVTINNAAGVTLTAALNLTGILTPTAGVLTTGGYLTLISGASSTACIASNVSGSPYISGNVSVERYTTRRRAYRFLASPVNTSNFISGSWQQATHITGSLTGLNGFDQSNSGSASLFTYNVSSEAWTAIPNTNASNLTIGTGYRMLIRGDRNIDLNSTTPPDSIALALSATGSIVMGNVVFGGGSVSSSPAGIPALNAAVGSGSNNSTIGWSLIGNPYACAVDWANVTKSNVSSTFATWNVNNAGRGNYIYHNGSAGTGFGASNIINSGQSIFVQTIAANPSITFAEASKVTSTPPSHFKKVLSNVLNIDIFIGDRAYDALSVLFDADNNNDYDVKDFIKLVNPEINFYSYLADGTKLAMNNMKEVQSETIVPLGLNGIFSGGSYELKFSNQNTFTHTEVKLKDKFMNKTYDLKSINTLTFTVTSDSNSFGENRFELIFSKSANGINNNLSSNNNNFMVFPNPANNVLNISLTTTREDNYSFVIYNQLGAEIRNGQLDFNYKRTNALNIENLSSGVYFIQVKNGQSSQTIKFIK